VASPAGSPTLMPGDFVYHKSHGTALYMGVKQMSTGNGLAPFFELEFAGGERVFVPANQQSLLEKVPAGSPPRIDRLRRSGPPPAPPLSLIHERARQAAGGQVASDPAATSDPLLEAARKASPDRRAAVERATKTWIERLIDLSRRNRLLFFQPLKVRTVELTAEQAERALPLVGGQAVPVRGIFRQAELIPRGEDVELFTEIEQVEDVDLGVVRRLQEIQKRGNEDFEERGLETVYFAYGMATWTPEDQGRPPEAAILMVPIHVEGASNRLVLEPIADVEINLALTHVLETLGCEGLGADLEELLAETDEDSAANRATAVLERLSTAAKGIPGFGVTRRAVIANFAFQKLAMVRDLQGWKDHMPGHDIVSAIAGDLPAKTELSEQRVDIDVRGLDRRSPDDEFLVMDADSSQLRAMAGIGKGQSGVVIGPPGTGKSQTIANLIGELVAQGKRVLFVAEKRAALEVVKKRLIRAGLGDLVLDLHGALSRKQIMSQFAEALTTVKTVLPTDVEDLHREFVSRRSLLNKHVDRVHEKRQPSGYTAYELIGHALSLESRGATSRTRWAGTSLTHMDRDRVSAIQEVLREAAAEPGLFLRKSTSPWTTAALPDRNAAETALATVATLNESLWPTLVDRLDRCVSSLTLRPPATLSDCSALLQKIEEMNAFLDIYKSELFSSDLASFAKALAPGRTAKGTLWATLFNRTFRAAKRQVRSYRARKAASRQLLSEVHLAAQLLEGWGRIAEPGSSPKAYAEISGLHEAVGDVTEALRTLQPFLAGSVELDKTSDIEGVLRRLEGDRETAMKIPRIRKLQNEMAALDALAFLAELSDIMAEPETWIPNLRHAWLRSCLDELRLAEASLAVFNGRQHDAAVEDFQELDRDRLKAAVARVLRAYGESVIQAQNAHREQELLLRRQAALRSRHLPFREVVRRAPEVVTAVKPCWMASPLAVSQLLGGTQSQYFDVVIFDEASQVLPEDAVTSILRGKTVVVAGDPEQLPPTQFFAADRDDDDSRPAEEEVVEGFESILNVMVAFLPRWTLDWHYRSKDERLIAFSNHYVYDDRLVTFPSPGTADSALRHELVQQERLGDIEELSSSAEVSAVVRLILDHAEKRPSLSLGVIAMGIRHSNRIDAELAKARQTRPDLDEFFDSDRGEKFFVKNLERVQGDERDAIILSIGYGKDASGKLPYRFGPLLSEGGYRRLNVAITRAKHMLTLVSSFSHHDMDPARSTRRGVEMLRLYLEYAASGGQVFGDGGPAPVERNEFEIQVQTALEHEGLRILPQYGASHYRIDLVVQHPDQPGRSVLAIECDGATYHSSPTARDRDRLRQEHLEARGWRFVRIWSTDWFTRRDEEIERILEAYRRELARGREEAQDANAEGDGEPSVIHPADVAESSQSRNVRPPIPRGMPITYYARHELARLANWVRSDGRLRTDDEIVDELMKDLRFQRRSRRIEATLRECLH
jgi:very-short-patch-repair endonuclease